MVNESIEQTKARLRERARKLRAGIDPADRERASEAAATWFLRAMALGPQTMVAGYWPVRDELNCRPLLLRLMNDAQPVCLPVVVQEDQPLQLRLWAPAASLYPSGFGTLAPSELAPVVEPDVVLVPLLGFDKDGTRLGYGGGYYDRTFAALARRPQVIGLAFSAQEFDTIPREPHDIPLDAIVTELGFRGFRG